MSKIHDIARLLAKYASLMITSWSSARPKIIFLMYHRVTGDVPLELDIPFEVFERQLQWLSSNTEIISLEEALGLFGDDKPELSSEKIKVILTFDDAYEDFYTRALPLLKKLEMPSVLYIPTEFIDDPNMLPISKPLYESEKLRPVSWGMLRILREEPLVTLAAHTHAHQELPDMSDEEIRKDLKVSENRFEKELGLQLRHFAYPRGKWDLRCEAVVREYYDSVALVGGGACFTGGVDRYRIPRVPVLKSDGLMWFKHRVNGRLVFEEKIASMIRRRSSY